MPNEPKVTVITPDKAQKLDIERVMSQLGEGFKLAVIRKEPVWCDGTLITEEIDPNEPISIENIRQRWGGRRLQLKILNPDGSYLKSTTVSFPDPHKKEGVEMVVGPDGMPTTKNTWFEKLYPTLKRIFPPTNSNGFIVRPLSI